MNLYDWLLLSICLLGAMWFLYRTQGNYFNRHGIKTLPTLPLVGHMGNVVLQKEHFNDIIKRIYNSFPSERYVGFQQLMDPVIMLRDLNLIKQITIKDFDHFQDRLTQIDNSVDSIFGGHLVALKGQKWRDMRATLSPAFTSSKMKGMFEFVEECSLQLVNYLTKLMKEPKNKDNVILEVEIQDLFKRYINDVIASTAFGLKINSLEDKNNDFYTTGKLASDFSGLQLLKFFTAVTAPKLMKLLGISMQDEKIKNFYRNIVSKTMKEREENNIIRPDMIHLLMLAKKGSLTHDAPDVGKETGFSTVEESSVGKETITRKWTDDDITAQAFLFLVAGFDTTAGLLSFMVQELMQNPDIQQRLQQEIDEVALANNGKMYYSDLHNMKYMDMVVCETLRMWPPFTVFDRKCVKPYYLPSPQESSNTKYLVKVNQGIQIPVNAIHHDSKYYKDPEIFDPERFSDERKDEINPLAYLPFGIGPRNCIGSRFALMESKVIIFHLLRNFNLVVAPKSEIPLKIKKNVFNLTAENGFWVGITPRI